MTTYSKISPNFSHYIPEGADPAQVKFKIANGGAGITGFVQFMAQQFLNATKASYAIEWLTSDTAETLEHLQNGTADVGWPYGIQRVLDAFKQEGSNLTQPHYCFRDHFALVGPKSNPAGLLDPAGNPHPTGFSRTQVLDMFRQIAAGQKGVYFLTRDDNSGTDVREKCLFEQATGTKPVVGTDAWYIKLSGTDHYPDAALKEANEKGYYTLTDRGIWTWANPDYKSDLQIYCEGGNEDADDILLNSCLVASHKGEVPQEATDFIDWLIGDGQNYIEQYVLNGANLYSKAPRGTLTPPDNPCG